VQTITFRFVLPKKAKRHYEQQSPLEATITDEDIEQFDQFAAEVRSRLPHMMFPEKRRVIEALKFTGTLAQEEGEKVLYIHWHIHTWRFSLHTDFASQ
jgi:hypothetical protein